jgi:DNA-directed RNA polymerase specialized sigma24 family protein
VSDEDDGPLLVSAGDDVAAFEALGRRYVARMTAFAVARCASPADVGDVVAQTFVRLVGPGRPGGRRPDHRGAHRRDGDDPD